MPTPVMVNVFPEPVCPYAMMVPLYPSNTEVTISLAHICKYTLSQRCVFLFQVWQEKLEYLVSVALRGLIQHSGEIELQHNKISDPRCCFRCESY